MGSEMCIRDSILYLGFLVVFLLTFIDSCLGLFRLEVGALLHGLLAEFARRGLLSFRSSFLELLFGALSKFNGGSGIVCCVNKYVYV